MTAQQPQHLAALAGDAAHYYHHDYPAWARTMAAAAHIARLAAAHQQRQEGIGTALERPGAVPVSLPPHLRSRATSVPRHPCRQDLVADISALRPRPAGDASPAHRSSRPR